MSRNNKLSDPQRKQICERYAAGESSNALGKEFGVSGVAIRQLLRTRGVARRPPPTTPMHSEREQIKIAEEYEMGRSAADIARKRRIDIGTVLNVLKRNEVKQRSHSEAHRRYKCDHAFFDAIDSERKAYWLGFIGADGYINPSHNASPEIKIALSARDKPHLYLLREHINSQHPVTDYRLKNRSYCRLQFRSRQIADALALHSITPRKTRTLRWPVLTLNASKHYFRGYVDGDGGFYAYGSSSARFSVTGNLLFLERAQHYLMHAANLSKTKIHRHKVSPDIGTLVYGGNRQVARIAHLLYDEATVYLDRKRERVAHLL